MPAAITDKFTHANNGTIAEPAQLSANKTTLDTTASLTLATGWPTDTAIHVEMFKVGTDGSVTAGTVTHWKATLSGTTLSNMTLKGGTNQSYATGDHVILMPTPYWANDVVDGILVQHKQDGTHADTITTDTINENTSANGVTIDGLSIKDSKLNTNNSVVTANITDGAVTPEKLLATTGSSWAWQSYTPTWTSITVGSGTNIGRYKQIGKTVYGVVKFIYGSGSSVGSSPIFSLPVAANTTAYTATIALLSSTVTYYDSGPDTLISGLVRLDSSSLAQPILTNVAGTYPTIVAVTATAPFTWATGDSLIATFAYEAA